MRDQMRETLIGKRIERVHVEDKSKYEGTIRATLLTQSPDVFQRRLEGSILVGIENVSQTLLLAADTGYTLSLGAIYGTTQFHLISDTLTAKTRPCLHLDFADGTYLTIVVNLFGTIRILDQEEKNAHLASCDPHLVTPDSERFTLDGFRAALAQPEIAKLSAKKLLTSRMPVYYVDGLGGGYVGEILYRAGIHPKRKLRTITADEQAAYYRAIREVTEEAIQQGGRWNEKDLLGRPGRFVPHVCKDTLGQPCPRCTAPIERFRFEGGYTYSCPVCQPPTRAASEALALARQGRAAWREKKLAEARQLLKQSQSLSQQEQYAIGVIGAQHLLANIAFDEGHLSESRALHKQVLAESRRMQWQGAVVSTLIGLGSVAALESRYDQARRHLRESIEIAREIGLPAYEAGAQQKLEWIAELEQKDRAEHGE
jgi:formamidopyrimidine-DNA glycosylase